MRRASAEAFQRRPEGEISVEVEERKEPKEIKPDIQDRAAEIKETAEVKTMQDIYGVIHKLEEQIGAMRRELALGTQNEEKRKEGEFFLSAKQEALEILEKMRDSKEETRLPKGKLEEIKKMRRDLETLEKEVLLDERAQVQSKAKNLFYAEKKVKAAYESTLAVVEGEVLRVLGRFLLWASPAQSQSREAGGVVAERRTLQAEALIKLAEVQKENEKDYVQTLKDAERSALRIKFLDFRNPLFRLIGALFDTQAETEFRGLKQDYLEKRRDILQKIEELKTSIQKEDKLHKNGNLNKINELRQKLLAEEQSITALIQERL